ncbi:restriction endonuclease subunit S [Leptospira adleri]|uniref:restriction endonuclease subunit S n=1 Tax=Leptospira adleri TaxID=2023186 RepID=UPI0010839257|nr:restriction endonuclease subunit S [Leptospira adleri]TGM58457.1 restriction endonuclease subunit S [Leptospira adleri]
MEVKQGYKQTEVGVIPEDWEVKRIGELIYNVEYGSSSKSLTEGKIPVLRMGNIQTGRIVWENLVYTNEELEIGKYLLRKDDILFNRTNTAELVGKTAIYTGEYPAIFAGYLIRINVNKNLLNPHYLNYFLNTEPAKKHSRLVLSIAVGQANINGEKLKKYPIPLPPTLTEQTAIANVLSDTDALIQSLEKLISKKQQIKQGTMQALLTGRKRLPGFEGEWETKTLGEIGECIIGLTYKPSEVTISGVLVLRSSNILNMKLVYQDNVFVNKPIPDKLIAKSKDILICVRNGSKELIGKCALIKGAAINQTFGAFMAIYRSPFNRFIFYLFQSNTIKKQIEEHIGATINQITNKSLNSFEIPFPKENEQTAIANVLSDLDAEIEALETKLEKVKLLKQGMMQQLLTGAIRLV